jgi:hypothetical protein
MSEARNEVDDVHDEAKFEPRHPQQPKHFSGLVFTQRMFPNSP